MKSTIHLRNLVHYRCQYSNRAKFQVLITSRLERNPQVLLNQLMHRSIFIYKNIY